MTKKEMANIAAIASRIKLDYPELTYKEAIDKAKEVFKSDKTSDSRRAKSKSKA